MNILIVENEAYLAQSIANKLTSLGHNCEILTKIKDILNTSKKDAILLSTSIFGEEIYEIIKKFKNSIIILLIPYISNDTVSRPIKAGANDYIQKPFMVEELIRKINHFEEFNKLKIINNSFMKYFEKSFASVKIPEFNFESLKFPLFIETNSKKMADKFVYEYSKWVKKSVKTIFLDEIDVLEKLENESFNVPIYLLNAHLFKNRSKLFKLVENKQVIINGLNIENEGNFETLTLITDEKPNLSKGEILTIDEYFAYIIKENQDVFSDTDLAKKLGISRKSLWEKRKKYGIQKQK
ncbi:DNA-binding transcriptional response regulator [Campylobacter ureolyticus]|uniref:Response regulator receiver domain-containing protein n=1 Tax=Campylobacter ureolyticus TaxID=827 RepID=A0AAE7E9I0_9BACT|nr:response regulator [Campylobacter ureolyticus]MCR8684602.1 response regulator [Campylobacter ureolyticus]QKF84108.1 response regulator receiver domain-containing protein [Campylobacter ureolyticus]QQY35746.1 response regulator [Campylobacter ureolyticus]SUX24043.1 cation-efflux system membrane protein [Campylobacter ureolyticus]